MPSTHVYFSMFFCLAMLWMAAAGGVFNGATISFGNKVWINAPFAVSQTITTLGYFGVVIIAAVMGRAVQQDFEYGIQDFFFSAPIKKYQYLLGRFLGAYLTLVYIFTSLGLGAWLATFLPAVSSEHLGPNIFLAYLLPYLFNILPNLFIFGAIFFTIAALTRRMLPVYVSSVVMLIGYLVASSLAREAEYRQLAALMDPFGSRAISKIVEYWPIFDRNHRLIPFEGVYLHNRLIWLSIAALVFGLGFWRFQFCSRLDVGGKGKVDTVAEKAKPQQVARYAPDFSQRKLLPMMWSMTWLNLRETVKNIYFIVIVLAGLLFMFALSLKIGNMYGTPTYPVTYQVMEMASGGFALFMLIITTFYAGELVWREREAGIALMHDALPLPSWLFFIPKLLTLIIVQGLLLVMVMLYGIGLQLVQGYTHLELGVYLSYLMLYLWPSYMLLAVLAIALQVLINNKYLAYFAMILYFIVLASRSLIGLEHPMLMYGQVSPLKYSDMNGYGHQVAPLVWFFVYWGGAALVLATVSLLFWPRGNNAQWNERKQQARRALSGPVLRYLAIGTFLFLGSGGVLYYNISIVNHFQSNFESNEQLASYERRYKRFEGRPQPRVTDVQFKLDLQPENRSAQLVGHYLLQNRSSRPIHEVFIQINHEIQIDYMGFDREAKLQLEDKKLGFYTYKLAEPLAANSSMALNFKLSVKPKGTLGLGSETGIIANGTFLNNQMMMPHIGYQPELELTEDRDRKKHGLAPKERKLPRDDARGLANNYISNDADWINFEATISTSPDQIAIAPGYLDKEWQENGRRYFHYKMDKPILNFYAVLSARYEVKKAEWKGMPIEIYYNKGHEYNLDRMISAVQQSLDYYTKNFSPYQHQQVRIVEFPRYASFAQSFPNTIPYSESIGFIAKVDDSKPKDIDYPFYVTAHEMAHQWWAHQVIAGNTRGATVLSETLSQYSALMVMKQRYGAAKMKRFLSYESDHYLMGRAVESKKELPLGHNEDQGYIHYRKGSLIMYALQDLIGEDKVNQALREVIRKYALQGAPYPSTTVLLQELRKVTPPDMQYYLDDSFEHIILYENRALSAQAKKLAKGQYELTLKVSTSKLSASEQGEERVVPVNDWIEIGVDDADGKPLLRQRKLLKSGEHSFTFTVQGEPAKAGIDPDEKLIDRKPDDNMLRVDMK